VGRCRALAVCAGLVCMGAAGSAQAGPRAGFFAPGSAPRAPEVMLYFSHSVGAGAGASMRPTFGLRVQQVHLASTSGDPQQRGDPMQHRELINWQMEGRPNLHGSNMRVKFGNRLTYDVTTQRFGSPSSRSAMQLGITTMRSGLPDVAPVRGSGAATAPVARDHDANRDNSTLREIAVDAMEALSPTRFTPAQRQLAQRQGGITGIVAAQRRLQAASTLR